MVAKIDSIGTLTFQASYEAYGKRSATQGATLDRQKANTKDEDPTGLLNEGYRYRDLDSGTFITRDPMGFVDGPNMYAYVRQNPWTKFDPLGLSEDDPLEWHHDIVKDKNNEMNKPAIEAGFDKEYIHSKENGTVFRKEDHRIKDADGLHTTGTASSRETWEEAQQEVARQWRRAHPDAAPTKEEVKGMIAALKNDDRFASQYSKGLKASMGYAEWGQPAGAAARLARFPELKALSKMTKVPVARMVAKGIIKKLPVVGYAISAAAVTVAVAEGQDVGDASLDEFAESSGAMLVKEKIESLGGVREVQGIQQKENQDIMNVLNSIPD